MTLSLVAVLLLAAPAEKLPDGVKLTKIEASPASIRIASPFAYAQVVLTGVTADGGRIDVTRMATFSAPASVNLTPAGLARPAADGKGTLTASLAGLKVEIPVEVTGQKETHETSFSRDVMPILSRLGCNAGTCHGAEAGRAGFKLSLRGYDPLFDHRALTDDLSARRVNRAAPDQSLMLLKLSGGVPHQGGVLTEPGQPYYDALRSWIASGSKLDTGAVRVKSVEVHPTSAVIALPGQKQQFAVIATYADGTRRDVTAEAFLESSNTEIATVDRASAVTSLRRGETAVMARYEGAYAAATLIVMGDRSGFAWKDVPAYNWIDELVQEKLKAVKVLPSDVCTDGEFVRRAYLDLTGTLPPVEATRAFLADTTPSKEKREKLIDSLIGGEDFIEHWTNKWADLLQVNRKFLGVNGAKAFREYIRKAVAENKRYDRFVYDVLTAKGSTLDSPAAAYYKTLRSADAVMENTTQLFLGVRFNCNKCHDHPFERWTQDQYYQLAAYFARVTRAEDPRNKGQRIAGSDVQPGGFPLIEVIGDAPGGEITHARTNTTTPPEFPYTHKDAAGAKDSRREQVAKWLTSPHNQYFARSYVNRLWAYMTGVGLIEPIDDIRAGNPPTNPKLLDRLTEEFIKSGFDTRHMLRLIARSRTYQHSVAANKWNEDDTVNYAKGTARRLPAEVLYDAIHKAAGAASRLPGLPSGARAAALIDSAQDAPGGFLDLLGKPPRESACECERVGGVQLGPVLTLVNGPVVGEAVADPANRIGALLRKEKDTRKIVEELYLAFLSRKPSAKELAATLEAIKDGEEDYEEQAAKHKAARAALTAHEKTIPARMVPWEASFSKKVDWHPTTLVNAVSKGKAKFEKQADGSLLVTGPIAAQELYTITIESPLKEITGIRLEVLPDDKLPAKGPGRADNGNFVLHELRLQAMEVGVPGKPAGVPLYNAQATFSQAGFEIAKAIDTNLGTGWAIAPNFGKATEALFQLRKPLTYAKGARITVLMDQRFGTNHVIGKFRISVTGTPGNLALNGPPAALAGILAVEPAKRTAQQKATLEAAFRAQDVELQRLVAEAARAYEPVDRRHPGVQDLVWALINSKAFQFNH